jgi:hypothetical protein
MVDLLLVVYLAGWLPVAVAAYAAGRRLTHRQSPADHASIVIVSLAAGAVWPLLIVGLVELSSIVVFTKVPSKHTRDVRIYA